MHPANVVDVWVHQPVIDLKIHTLSALCCAHHKISEFHCAVEHNYQDFAIHNTESSAVTSQCKSQWYWCDRFVLNRDSAWGTASDILEVLNTSNRVWPWVRWHRSEHEGSLFCIVRHAHYENHLAHMWTISMVYARPGFLNASILLFRDHCLSNYWSDWQWQHDA